LFRLSTFLKLNVIIGFIVFCSYYFAKILSRRIMRRLLINSYRLRILFWPLAVSTIISGCGGGSSSSSPPLAAPAAPIAVLKSSYDNFKSSGLTPQTLPVNNAGNGSTTAFADFYRRGEFDLFTATITYSPSRPIASATPSTFEFWKKGADGTFVKDTTLLKNANTGCMHPRKALVADFNGDARPDVFVICHGYDAPPFPGEANRLVLSQSDGSYSIVEPNSDIGFWHGGSAADVNADGLVDIVLTENFTDRLVTFLNQGTGKFSREARGRFSAASTNNKLFFSFEFADVDGDGKLDAIAGGHEWESNTDTVVMLNPGNYNFSAVTPIAIPAVPGEGVVLDFTVTGSGASRTLWVLRTSGGDGTFYQSRTVQKVTWPGLVSTIPVKQRPAQWIPWLIPTSVNGQAVVTSENKAFTTQIPQ
jgi:hypothetical protein